MRPYSSPPEQITTNSVSWTSPVSAYLSFLFRFFLVAYLHKVAKVVNLVVILSVFLICTSILHKYYSTLKIPCQNSYALLLSIVKFLVPLPKLVSQINKKIRTKNSYLRTKWGKKEFLKVIKKILNRD